MQKLTFLCMCSKQTALAHVEILTNSGPAEGKLCWCAWCTVFWCFPLWFSSRCKATRSCCVVHVVYLLIYRHLQNHSWRANWDILYIKDSAHQNQEWGDKSAWIYPRPAGEEIFGPVKIYHLESHWQSRSEHTNYLVSFHPLKCFCPFCLNKR